ncbi:chromate transporter [Roseomonas sp. GC11]|uniref:chromate transporter n=1 Tax=Roseomonas sp. GC11 TaxID=2950546 RepID=UPI00210E25B3|nr:chromate transporter [Roseomonas sp. GC11]MCQ4159465.1 chromate transporter [Roseomonas sp. GC11]
MTPSPLPPPAEGGPPPRTAELFTGFLLLGLSGFGGVLPMARHMMVERRRWLSAAEFLDLLGLCQFLPGGNIINMSVAVGLRFRGVRGAAAALVGLISAPTVIVVALGTLYTRFQDAPAMGHMFAGLAAAASALLVTMALKLLRPLRGQPLALGIVALAVVAIALLRLPLLPTMLVLAPAGILLARGRAA